MQLVFPTLPIYMQIVQHFRNEILANRLLPRTKMPPTRTLAKQLGINWMTVAKAYTILAQQGILVAQSTKAMVVADMAVAKLKQLDIVAAKARSLARDAQDAGIDVEELIRILREAK